MCTLRDVDVHCVLSGPHTPEDYGATLFTSATTRLDARRTVLLRQPDWTDLRVHVVDTMIMTTVPSAGLYTVTVFLDATETLYAPLLVRLPV